jgi:integrase
MAQGVLNQILKRAVRDEYLERNPLAGFTRPRSQKREHHWATPEEVEKLRGWFLTPRPPTGKARGGTPPIFPTHDHSDPLAALLISILSYVGIRPQDALALRWDDLKGDRLRVERKVSDGRIIAGSKTGDRYRRSVLVPGPVAQEFIETRFVFGRPEGLIFPRRKDGQPWTKDDWNRWRSRRFYKARDDAGLPKAFSPYSLRHSAASIQIAAGWSPHEVARQLGHSVVMSLRVYQHSFDEQEGKTPIALDEQIREARKVA